MNKHHVSLCISTAKSPARVNSLKNVGHKKDNRFGGSDHRMHVVKPLRHINDQVVDNKSEALLGHEYKETDSGQQQE